MSVEATRRQLLAASASIAFAAVARSAFGRPRSPVGGNVSMRVPWPVSSVDPHRLDDATAAIFGGALFEGLYAMGEGGDVVPVLADAMPEARGGSLRVAIRSGIRTARDRAFDARDALASIVRARSLGAHGWLADVPKPHLDGRGALLFETSNADKLVRALASPLVAMVPSEFSPERPDGTGPFVAEARSDALVFRRNPRAASGPSFLDEVTVHAATDLADSLRAFEAGIDDVGWLGSGLHEPRAGARPFDLGPVGWAVLRTGRDAGTWDMPGVAQRLADGVPPSRLTYLSLGTPWTAQAEQGWGGAPCDMLVRDDSPWLIELARALSATIARPSHEITVKPVPPGEIARLRVPRTYSLMVDVVRPLAPGPLGTFAALTTANEPSTAPDIVRHAPRLGGMPARTLPRTMRLGIVGEIRVQGSRLADLTLPFAPTAGLDLGDATRARKTP